MHFDISIAVWAGLGIYALYTGIKRWRQKNAANIYRYTKESVARFSKWYGILASLYPHPDKRPVRCGSGNRPLYRIQEGSCGKSQIDATADRIRVPDIRFRLRYPALSRYPAPAGIPHRR